MLGGILFGFMGHWTLKHGRDPIVILGFILSMVSYFFIFLNIPMNAISDELDPWEYGYIRPNIHLTLFTSFLLGFSDACFMTQVKTSHQQVLSTIISGSVDTWGHFPRASFFCFWNLQVCPVPCLLCWVCLLIIHESTLAVADCHHL